MKSQGFEILGARLRSELARHEEVDRPSEARSRRRVLARMPAKKPSRVAYALAVGLCVAAAALAFVWRGQAPAGEPLRFWIEDRSGHVDDWVTARDNEQSLRFSDGSSVVAKPQTTTRVMQLTPEGAELTLERGQIDAHVVHRSEASRWQVAAGPFVVHVTGTRFHVSWDPQAERIIVSVSEGRVEVTGGGQPKLELTAGSALELRVAASLKTAVELPSTAPAPSVAPSEPPAEHARDEDELTLRPKASERKPDFRELSVSGHYREALAAVEALGFESQCQSLSAKDLLTLGSTARLAGSSGRAREAYMAARRRFPRSSEAGISAFSLGRLAADGGHASDASGWFQRYLTEQPRGPLAREAAGRLIELARQSGDEARARRAAQSYLEQYPTGPHAALARSLLSRP